MLTDERLRKLLAAPVEVLAEVDRILEGGVPVKRAVSTEPLLLGMGAGARYLGVSRATLWRMIRAGRIEKVEILTGSFRVRRADLEEVAAGRAPTSQPKSFSQ
jgi:excisionase family DNA binding protein